MIKRDLGTAWRQVTADEERPHAGRFERLTSDAELAFIVASERLERIDQCRRWLSPGDNTEACNYEVTPGGLTYQDAALQCLLDNARYPLEYYSQQAGYVAAREREACAGRGCRYVVQPDGYRMLCRLDGSRSIFDDVDQ